MVDNLRRELKSLILLVALAIVSVLLVLLMVGSGMAGSRGLFESPTSPLPISPVSPMSPIPSPSGHEGVGPSTPILIAVRTQPNYLPWILGGLAIVGGVAVGVVLYRRVRGDEG